MFRANAGSVRANARSLRDELAELPSSLAQARSFQNLGDRPLVVVTAALDAHAGWSPLQAEMATLSRTAAIASCPALMMRSSMIRPPHKPRVRRVATWSMRCVSLHP